jgi:hypothetical protein
VPEIEETLRELAWQGGQDAEDPRASPPVPSRRGHERRAEPLEVGPPFALLYLQSPQCHVVDGEGGRWYCGRKRFLAWRQKENLNDGHPVGSVMVCWIDSTPFSCPAKDAEWS